MLLVDLQLPLERLELLLAHIALLVDITLLPTDKTALVHIRMHLDVRVVGQLEVVPFRVVERHAEVAALLDLVSVAGDD